MSIDMELNPSRRDFLTLAFAKKPRGGGQSSQRRSSGANSNQSQPDGGFKFTRRQALIGGSIIGGGVLAGILKPWERFIQDQPEQITPEPETLDGLITKGKKMEAEFKGQDLSDQKIRKEYADVLAGIFALHNPGYLSAQQLKESITFENTIQGFTQQRIDSSGKIGTPTPLQLDNERSTTASTLNRGRKITVNTASEAFKQKNLPAGWNPLKFLRLSLLHEFNHLVIESTDQTIFSIMDPNNRLKDKRIEGFRIVGVNEKGGFDEAFNDLHESTIELLARNISQADFGSHYSNMDSEGTGENLTALMGRLDQILQLIGMNYQELIILFRNSNLRRFLTTLAEKAGVNPSAPLDSKIRTGSIVAGAIERNDQRAIQNYINQVKQFQAR